MKPHCTRALITGASSGIGRALALELARRHGIGSVLVARRQPLLEQLAAELDEIGVEAQVLVADLGTREGLSHVLESVDWSRIDLLVNNASSSRNIPFVELEPEAISTMLDLAAKAPALLIHRFLNARSTGAILNIGSLAGVAPFPNMSHIGAIKRYVFELGESLAIAAPGVHFSTAIVGDVDTPGWRSFFAIDAKREVGPLMDADRCARLIVRGLFAGRTRIIPGPQAKLFYLGLGLLPRRWCYRLDQPQTRRFSGQS